MAAIQNTLAIDAFSGFAMPLFTDDLQGFRIDRFLGLASSGARRTPESRGAEVRDRVVADGASGAEATDRLRTIALNDVMSSIADVNVARDLEWLGSTLCIVSAVLTAAGIGVVLGGIFLG